MASNPKNITDLVPGGKKAPKPSTENIDERILRLLGLEGFEVEMDYDTYRFALREFMTGGRMGTSKYPSSEVELVTNEWKRVKRKKGRFKKKVKKIQAKDIKKGGATGTGVGAKTTTVSAQKLLPGTAEESPAIGNIVESLDNIAGYLKAENKADKKKAEQDRKQSVRSRRENMLGGLKKGAAKIAKVADKIISPVKNILQRILEWFIKIVLARAVIKLLEWFSDPKNKGKVDTIFRFLEDWWPALLGGYILFGTSFGGFITGLIPMLVGWTVKLGALLTANPWLLAAAGLGVGIYGIGKMLGKDKVVENETERANISREALEKAPSTKDLTPGDREALVQGTRLRDAGGGGSLNNMRDIHNDPLGIRPGGWDAIGGGGPLGGMPGLSGGGLFDGFVSGDKGVDKVPAMLTDGEFVMSKGAVKKYGTGTLEAMNAAGGGTNRPKMVSGTAFAQGGGQVGKGHDKPQKKESLWTLGASAGITGEKKGKEVKTPNLNIDVNQPQGAMRWLAGAADAVTGGWFDFDKRGGGGADIIKTAKKLHNLLTKKPEKKEVSTKIPSGTVIPKVKLGPPRNKDGSISTRIGKNELGDTPMEQWAKNFPHLAKNVKNRTAVDTNTSQQLKLIRERAKAESLSKSGNTQLAEQGKSRLNVLLAVKPNRSDYGEGKTGDSEYKIALVKWQTSRSAKMSQDQSNFKKAPPAPPSLPVHKLKSSASNKDTNISSTIPTAKKGSSAPIISASSGFTKTTAQKLQIV